jgi:hypothetical protein
MANIEQLDLALKWIEANPTLHDQFMWATRTECGTTMCLAMVVAVQNGWRPSFGGSYSATTAWVVDEFGNRRCVDLVARELLDLSPGQAHSLFYSFGDLTALKSLRNLIARGVL